MWPPMGFLASATNIAAAPGSDTTGRVQWMYLVVDGASFTLVGHDDGHVELFGGLDETAQHVAQLLLAVGQLSSAGEINAG